VPTLRVDTQEEQDFIKPLLHSFVEKLIGDHHPCEQYVELEQNNSQNVKENFVNLDDVINHLQ